MIGDQFWFCLQVWVVQLVALNLLVLGKHEDIIKINSFIAFIHIACTIVAVVINQC